MKKEEEKKTHTLVLPEELAALFVDFETQLKSYLYRLTTDRQDAEDICQETFIKAYEKLSTYRGESSLKTWVFQIATNLALNMSKRQKRWTADVSEQAKNLVLENPSLAQRISQTRENSPEGIYEMREHISTCFTCIAKNLPIEKQIAVILKDIYDFSSKEIALILSKSIPSVKYLVSDGRDTLDRVYKNRCALVNQNGVCHQCAELNQWLNPNRNQKEDLKEIENNLTPKDLSKTNLYNLRTLLVKTIDPFQSEGSSLQDLLLLCNRMAMGEIPVE